MAVYPEAKVDMDARGLILNPSRPPVAPKVVSFAAIKRLKIRTSAQVTPRRVQF
jgi:hypothetical protein